MGAISMLPLIADEMTSHGWMTSKEVADIVSIAEMTPGPLGLNCATYAGIRTAGLLGAVAANLGVLMPSLSIGILAAIFFERFKSSRIISNSLVGIRPACIGMILGVAVSLAQTNYFSVGKIDTVAVFIGVIALFLQLGLKMSVPKVIAISALIGLLAYQIFPSL